MTGRRHRPGLAVLAVAGFLLASCSSAPQLDLTISAPADKADGPAPPPEIAVSPVNGSAAVSPAVPIVVRAQHGTLDAVRVTNAAGEPVKGRLSDDGMVWRSSEPLGYAKTYTVDATGRGSEDRTVADRATFRTVDPEALTSVSVLPGPNRATVGIGHPIVVRFDNDVVNKAVAEQSLQVRTFPPVVGSWYWIDDSRVRWRPKEYWKPGTKVLVDINIYGRPLGDGRYGAADRRMAFGIHDAWVAKGDVAAHTLEVFHNGVPVKTLPTSFGRPKYPTHDGVHVVQVKHELFMMNSETWGLPADSPDGYSNFPAHWAVRVSNGGEFVHANDGTAYAHGNDNVSHGCINLTMERAKWFYDRFNTGDLVIINGGSPMLQVWDGFGGWNVPWEEWLAGSALR